MSGNITVSDFFKYYIIHPFSQELDRATQAGLFVASVALGILTLGICHLFCAIAYRSYVPQPPGTKTSATQIFDAMLREGQSIDRPFRREFWEHFLNPAQKELFRAYELVHNYLMENKLFDCTDFTDEEYECLADNVIEAYHPQQQLSAQEKDKLKNEFIFNLKNAQETRSSAEKEDKKSLHSPLATWLGNGGESYPIIDHKSRAGQRNYRHLL